MVVLMKFSHGTSRILGQNPWDHFQGKQSGLGTCVCSLPVHFYEVIVIFRLWDEIQRSGRAGSQPRFSEPVPGPRLRTSSARPLNYPIYCFPVWGNSTVGPDLGSAWDQEPGSRPQAENQLGPTVEFLPRVLLAFSNCFIQIRELSQLLDPCLMLD